MIRIHDDRLGTRDEFRREELRDEAIHRARRTPRGKRLYGVYLEIRHCGYWTPRGARWGSIADSVDAEWNALVSEHYRD